MATERSFSVELPVTPETVRPHIIELDRYPSWNPLVHAATPAGEGMWNVELRAKVGPFARSKRLRMRRTLLTDREVVFERDEGQGRRHSTWVLHGEFVASGNVTTVTMHLRYGGSLWGPVLDAVLADRVEAGREGLRRVTASGSS